ncbi:Wzz/FepE/Etk N-terminal domain-containing protein [Pseudoalteromonas fuliginea]|uniref:Lipopolysaccharide biosynthesis protein n=1 Tax=Pseudoalteromonas fuliginea TaxID=1872678 RepID=A0ABD3Y5V5_9GAMM|nr:Wzz/FepE/Etk N-terminal domain-containing protein [Pseudoalteromonas fuliginea]KDC49453.1 lipopolysaccharide biosynthesis protein [Pseudoalteromonas fuliginea]KJZ27735.1 lipopolysaccharide biosynthesis protein [Pseudoalteromonas fuliginea]
MENNLNNPKQANVLAVADDEIDLRELFTAIWQGKWIIIAVTTLFAVASVFYAINQPNIYKSEALLAPTETPKNASLGGLAGQFGSLASLAGVNLSGGGNNKSQLAIEVLKSRHFISEFIKRHNILADLMAVKEWDSVNNTIVYNSDLYNIKSKEWTRKVKAPFKPIPSMQEAYKVFIDKSQFISNEDTGMIVVSIEHISPVIAQQWVSWLVEDINEVMKERDVTEAKRSSEFLENQLKKTKIADIRVVLYKLIEEQTKTIMFANVRDEYVFKTIDPAVIPEQKSKPARAMICILGTMLGVILSVFLILVRYFIKRQD